jgi:HK97 gp10 family phage protein
MSVDIELTLDLDPKALKKLDKIVDRALTESGILIQSRAKQLAPVDFGQLRKSISRALDSGQKTITVFTNLEYAIFVEFGTGIHAEDGKGKREPWTYFSKRLGRYVTTQGHKSRPFMRVALLGARNSIATIFKKRLDEGA